MNEMDDAEKRERTALLAQVEAACKREADSREAFLAVRAELAADAGHLQFILELLDITRDAELTYEDCPFLWHVSDGRAVFSMVCSDTFAWGCADAETIEPGDIPLLRTCLADLRTAGKYEEAWLGILFCARKRGMRPMNRWMKDMRSNEEMPDGVYALFCAAGPERESVFGAP